MGIVPPRSFSDTFLASRNGTDALGSLYLAIISKAPERSNRINKPLLSLSVKKSL